MGPIELFLGAFDDAIHSGFANLHDPVFGLFSTFVAIGLTLYFVFEVAENRLSWPGIATRLIWIAFWSMIIHAGAETFETLAAGFVELGLIAGGNQISVAEFFNPGNIAGVGSELAKPLFDAAHALGGPIGTFQNFVTIIAYEFTGWCLIISFAILAVAVFAAIVIYKLASITAFLLLIFVGWHKTFFITAGGIGGTLMGVIKLCGFAICSSIISGVVDTLQVAANPGYDEVIGLILLSLVIIGIALFGGNSAINVASGTARGMGLGTAVASTIATAGAVMAPAMALGGAVRSAGSAAQILKAGGNAAGQTLAKTGDAMAAIRAGSTAAGTMAQGGGNAAGAAGARMAARRGGATHAAHAARLALPDDDGGGQMNANSLGQGR